MGALPLETVPARTLKVGDNIRLEADRFERIASIGFEETQFIVGGSRNETAAALKVRTFEGTEFLVHPGSIMGIKRDRWSVVVNNRRQNLWRIRRLIDVLQFRPDIA